MERQHIADLVDFIVHSIRSAPAVGEPFHHLAFPKVFPEDIYSELVRSIPDMSYFRGMAGRAKESNRADGTPTRLKLDLLPQRMACLPPEHRPLWQGLGTALCQPEVQSALVARLAPALETRFGERLGKLPLYPMPSLFRDLPGYFIPPHTDTHWKAITVQFCLPTDNEIAHVGTIFHRALPDGRKERAVQMPFAPNGGYAFAVGSDSWHSVDMVGPEVTSRDSILLTYYLDEGWLRYLRNRSRRAGSIVQSQMLRLLQHSA